MSRSIGRKFVLGLIALLLIGVGVTLTACGNSADQDEINQAKEEGAKEAQEEIRIKAIQKELRALRREGGGKPAPAHGGSVSSEGDSSSCGGELSVNSVTSCPFAENVRSAYFEELGSGSGTVYAYSPTTNQSYSMYCTAGTPHECTGGNDAAVYFP